jgi:hypothetical protein
MPSLPRVLQRLKEGLAEEALAELTPWQKQQHQQQHQALAAEDQASPTCKKDKRRQRGSSGAQQQQQQQPPPQAQQGGAWFSWTSRAASRQLSREASLDVTSPGEPKQAALDDVLLAAALQQQLRLSPRDLAPQPEHARACVSPSNDDCLSMDEGTDTQGECDGDDMGGDFQLAAYCHAEGDASFTAAAAGQAGAVALEECNVCMEWQPPVVLQPCQHVLCGEWQQAQQLHVACVPSKHVGCLPASMSCPTPHPLPLAAAHPCSLLRGRRVRQLQPHSLAVPLLPCAHCGLPLSIAAGAAGVQLPGS